MDAASLYLTPRGKVRVDRSLVYPPLVALMDRALVRCADAGHLYRVIEGWRAPERQAELHAAYMIGHGPRATALRWAYHPLGLALDAHPDGVEHPTSADYAPMVRACGAIVGIVSGAGFDDPPHVQLGIATRLIPALADLYARTPGDVRAKLAAVWRRVDEIRGVRVPPMTTAQVVARGAP